MSGVSMVLLTENSPAGMREGVCSHGRDDEVGTNGAIALMERLPG